MLCYGCRQSATSFTMIVDDCPPSKISAFLCSNSKRHSSYSNAPDVHCFPPHSSSASFHSHAICNRISFYRLLNIFSVSFPLFLRPFIFICCVRLCRHSCCIRSHTFDGRLVAVAASRFLFSSFFEQKKEEK